MADLKISALTSATTPLAGTEVLPIVQSSTTKQVSVANLTAGRAVAVKNLTATDLTAGRVPYVGTGGLIQDDGDFLFDGTTVTLRGPRGTYTMVFYNTNDGSNSGRMGTISGNIFNIDATGTSNILTLSSNGTEAIRVDASANAQITTGNLVIGTSGKGIDFSATAGTGTSELLADYEEGTWTPVLKFGGLTTGITYSTQSGTYTKTGRMVCARATIALTSNGSASGGATVTGLPFTVAVTTAASIYQDGISYVGMINLGVEGTVDRFAIQQVSAAGVNSNLDRLNFSNTAFFTLAVCYQV